MIHHGDCVEVMRTFEAESIDAICTDPPYGLGFMGKAWDSAKAMHLPPSAQALDTPLARFRTGKGPDAVAWNGKAYQAWCTEWAREAFRVAKPGAYLLAFGGTRTVHRLASAIEDAGWEIRDELIWIYASGFPKSLDVSKALDKAAGAEREDMLEDKPGVTDNLAYGHGLGVGIIERRPVTDLAKQWEGWGTALKPAHEPIVMARKPLVGSVAANVSRYGTGALNIGATRIGTGEDKGIWPQTDRPVGTTFGQVVGPGETNTAQGRWPSNLLLSDPELFDVANPDVVGSGAVAGASGPVDVQRARSAFGGAGGERDFPFYGDSGGYSRFYLIPKSSRSDREPVLKDAAVLLHQARGECDKLGVSTSSTSPARATSEATTTDASPSVMSRPGRTPTDPSLLATSSTTSTATSRTTGSPISSSSTPLPISASTPVVSSETGNGGSPVASADNSSLWGESIGTSADKAGRSMGGAARATFGSSSKRNRCAVCGKQLPRVSTHPTQKPTDLMAHLIKLVTPPGGVILDPFLGSGSTAIAAERLGVEWIGIEKEAEYVAIAEARLNGVQRGLGLDFGAASP